MNKTLLLILAALFVVIGTFILFVASWDSAHKHSITSNTSTWGTLI